MKKERAASARSSGVIHTHMSSNSIAVTLTNTQARISSVSTIPKIGVGLAYQGPLRSFIETSEGVLDFIEVVPDILWTDLGRDRSPRYVEDQASVDFIRQVRSRMPVIPHGIGLSIGSAHRFNREHIGQLSAWQERFHFPWHSDHLSYNLAAQGAGEINVGVTLPLPHDQEVLDLLVPRIAEIRAAMPVPFALENNVYYFDMPGQDMTEVEFLNRLCGLSGCYLLLDLHNLYVNARNLRVDPLAFLDALDLDNVIEIHLAGGMELDGFYLDAHSGCVPAAVWELLDRTLPQCRNLGGVTFELFGSWFSKVGDDRLTAELSTIKNLWARHQPV